MSAAKTIFITGASSGIGKTTAKYFATTKGWNVVATMRNPEKETELTELGDNVLVTTLDVTNDDSIEKAVSAAISKFNKIDVLLNNAGYGAYGPLEAFPMEKVKKQFDTNVIGLLAVTKAVLPHMRKEKSGVIINISSIGGQVTFPLGSLYHGSKFAVEGASEALHFELEPIGIHVKIVEPGMIKTDFGGRSFDFVNDSSMEEYQPTVQKLFAYWGPMGAMASEPDVVADVIFEAATDGTNKLRYPAGKDAEALLEKRKKEDDETFIGQMKKDMGYEE